ncbi:MAG: ABC transporter substrate-binding protein [Candidatus Rokuibacteriota bacterium]
MRMTRRAFLRTTGAGAAALGAGRAAPAFAQKKQTVTIAFPETVTSLDPQPASRNTPRESMYEAVFDRYVQQDRQLKYQPHLVEAWQWAAPDKMSMDLKIRQGVKFHDDADLTAEDVAFSLDRMRVTPPYKVVYEKIKEIQVRDRANIHLEFARFDPSFPRWLGFLASFVIPKGYFTRVGAEEFARKPVGSGPYRVVSFTPGSTLVLEAFDRYWKGAPPIKRAVFKMITDPTARVAEILSGSADITAEVPVEEFARLSGQPGLKGLRQTIADMAQIFVNPRFAPFQKEEVRLAVHHAIDKKTLVDKVLLGFGVPSSSTEGALYDAHDPTLTFAYDPARARTLLQKAGYAPANPLRLKVMTTRGTRAKDFEVVTAITQMWGDVGIEAEVEVITIPQWFGLRNARGEGGKDLAPLSLYFWSNATGDPINSVGFQNNMKGPFRVWESEEMPALIAPVFEEKDEAKRIAAAKKAARHVIEHGYVIPLFQVVQPIILKKELSYQPFPTGILIPQEMSWA